MNYLFLGWLVMITAVCHLHAEWLPLWPDGAPCKMEPAALEEAVNKKGRIIEVPEPTCWFSPADPAKKTGAVVIVFPGGAYSHLAIGHEGMDYAKWLNQRGVAAVVVKYRVRGKSQKLGALYPAPLLDARRAIRMVRERAAVWGVDPMKVGVMGSSAGGHLASMCATMYEATFHEEHPEVSVSCRPDFAIFVYPVIGLDDPSFGNRGTAGNLLGENPDDGMLRELSTYRLVKKGMPPCFLVHAADDGAVAVKNSLEFVEQCSEQQVPVVCHVVSKGGHGFGLGKKGDSLHWPEFLEQWLVDREWAQRP